MRTALAQRQIVDDAIAKTAAARSTPPKSKKVGDDFDSGSMTGIDSRMPSALEIWNGSPMFKPSHLTDEAANVLAGAIDEQVYFVQSKRWIAYPKAVVILDHLNKLLKHPRTTRMPSLVVYGDSGMGKSMLVDKFKADCAAGSASIAKKLLVVELTGDQTSEGTFLRSSPPSKRRTAREATSSIWREAPSTRFETLAFKFLFSTRFTIFSPGHGGNSASF
jgi:hypothetical protein